MRIAILSIASLSIVSLLACGQPTATDTDTPARVTALEKRVAALEKNSKQPQRPQRPAPKPQERAFKIPLGDSPVLGTRGAPVEVVVFSDYQCPYCARVDPMLRALTDDPQLAGKVQVVFKQFPLAFHKGAKPAAKAAMAAREQGEEFFWKMSERLFANPRALNADSFKSWARELGLEVGRFEADLAANDARYEAAIEADMQLGQRSAQVRGTPSIFVNGWRLEQRSVDGVKALIKEKRLTQL